MRKKPIAFGKYLLLERISVGGMAEVFVGKALGRGGSGRPLAVKRILPTMVEDAEFVGMFLDEARLMARLRHPNIVSTDEVGSCQGGHYIAMEYLSGKDLRQILEYYRKSKKSMPVPHAALIASKVCEGLSHAHRCKDAKGRDLGIVHRDVNPQNILISYDGEVKLIDFGIARAADRRQQTQAGILKGKLGYMSPEQARGLPVDQRTDLFAMGVVLYEMLTGAHPFAASSEFSTLRKMRDADVPPPRGHAPHLPAQLERVVLKCLAVKARDRFQDCEQLAQELAPYLPFGGARQGSQQLAGFLREAFAADLDRDRARLERCAAMSSPEPVTELAELPPSEPAADAPRCPQCGKQMQHGDFLCPACELIVDFTPVREAPKPVHQPSIVRALLAPPEAALEPAPPAPPRRAASARGGPPVATSRFVRLASESDIPRVTLALDSGRTRLSSLEAFVVSLVDGRSSVEQIGSLSGLSPIELQSVLHTLLARDFVRIAPQPPVLPPPLPRRGRPPRAEPRDLQRAIDLERQGRSGEAIAVLESAIARSSDSAPLYNRLALALVREYRNFDRAAALLRRAIDLDPENGTFRENFKRISAGATALRGRRTTTTPR